MCFGGQEGRFQSYVCLGDEESEWLKRILVLGVEKVNYFEMMFLSGDKVLDSVKGIYASDIFDGLNNILVMA